MGSNRGESNIAIAILDNWRIWTYPISPFNELSNILIKYQYEHFTPAFTTQ